MRRSGEELQTGRRGPVRAMHARCKSRSAHLLRHDRHDGRQNPLHPKHRSGRAIARNAGRAAPRIDAAAARAAARARDPCNEPPREFALRRCAELERIRMVEDILARGGTAQMMPGVGDLQRSDVPRGIGEHQQTAPHARLWHRNSAASVTVRHCCNASVIAIDSGACGDDGSSLVKA